MDTPPFPPAAIAAARDAAKAHLRFSGPDEDAALGEFAATALSLAEAFTGVALIVREWRQIVASSPRWQSLSIAPVQAIEMVETIGLDGASEPLPVASYAIDIDAHAQGRIRLDGAGGARRARVHFLAGMADDWAALPAPIRQGVTILTAHLFEARQAEAAPPAAVAALWRPWRRARIAA